MSEEEVWRPIPGFEGLYEASSAGRIRGVTRTVVLHKKHGDFQYHKKGQIIKQLFDGRGLYLQAALSKNGRSRKYLTHRLVALSFLDNPQNLPEVNHKDEDKTNNAVSNLEWCDHKYNNNYGSKLHRTRGENNPQNKFQEEIVREIKHSWVSGDPQYGTTALAKKYNMSASHLSSIIHGRRWSWLE